MKPGAAMRNWLADYTARCKAALDGLDRDGVARIVELLADARGRGRTVFAAGNGGSAATASHFATDLIKLASAPAAPFRALALSDNAPLLTALGNDVGYDAVFVEQLRTLGQAGDVLVAFSTSGNSPNVVKAVEFARSAGMATVALTGADGGQLAGLADCVLKIADDHVGRVEDAHLIVVHLICYAFAEGAAGSGAG